MFKVYFHLRQSQQARMSAFGSRMLKYNHHVYVSQQSVVVVVLLCCCELRLTDGHRHTLRPLAGGGDMKGRYEQAGLHVSGKFGRHQNCG